MKPNYRGVAVFYDGEDTVTAYRTKRQAENWAAYRARLNGCEYFIAKVSDWVRYEALEEDVT